MKRYIRPGIASALSAIIARFVVKPTFLLFVHRARPHLPGSTDSFPSGHTIFFFAAAAAIFAYEKKLGWLAYGVATLVGIERIVVGAHWPTDVLGGAILGILTGWTIVHLIPALRPRTI